MAPGGVVLTDVTVRAGGETLVDHVGFTAPAGETTVLLGSTESGAATTIKAIAGLVRVNEGRIEVNGLDVTRARPGRRNVAVVFEAHTLFPHMTIFENVAYPLRVARLDPVEIERRVGAIAERLGFASALDEKPRGVAEGMKRRAGLARAIVRAPAAYLLDRTLASLDDDFRGAAREAIEFLREQGGATILWPSADGAEATRLADRLVVMAEGRVLEEGPTQAVRQSPSSFAVANQVLGADVEFCEGVVLAVRGNGLTVRLPGDAQLDLPVDPAEAEVGERLTLGAPPEALARSGWIGLEPSAMMVFDSVGRPMRARALA